VQLIIALLSLGVIANAETLIGQEFSQLIYVFEFLLETHRSNPYIGELSEFSFERDFPRVTEERYFPDFRTDANLEPILRLVERLEKYQVMAAKEVDCWFGYLGLSESARF
jgi:hypothetical protein